MSEMQLKISSTLSVPLDWVTEACAILAKRNAGKTYTAKKVAEEMLRAKQQVIALDPVDVWYGLRSSADGKEAGYPIAVFGGDHGDVPLEPDAGAYIADLLTGERLSAVLCVKRFSKTQQRTFVAAFAERLLQRNSEPVHVFLEEAHMWVPQRPQQGDQRMLGAVSDLTTTGRSAGIGTSLITQRAARVHKDPLEQTDNLIVLQTVGPNDRRAVEGWVTAQDLSDVGREVLRSLPTLKQGEAWVCSPSLLGDPQRVQIAPLTTFDSSATPKPGKARTEPKTLADVDLDRVREAMADTIARAEADDPKVLRRRIAKLEADLLAVGEAEQEHAYLRGFEAGKAEAGPVIPAGRVERWENLGKTHVGNLAQLLEQGSKVQERIAGLLEEMFAALNAPGYEAEMQAVAASAAPALEPRHTRRLAAVPPPREDPAPATPPESTETIGGPERRVLAALAWWSVLGKESPSRLQVAVVAGYHPRTKGFTNALGSLRSAGRIDYPIPGQVGLTSEGRAIADWPATPGTSADLQAMIYAQVGTARTAILRNLIEVYPGHLTREELATGLGRHPRTKGFTNALGSLRSLGLIDYPQPGTVIATDALFVR